MKLAVIVGHNRKRQGAVRVTDGRTEFDWMGELAEMIAAAGDGVRVFHRIDRGDGYSAEIDRVYSEVNAYDPDLYVELHFNGGPDSAHGAETLSSGSSGSLRFCENLQRVFVEVLGARDRGVKVVGRGDRGGRSLFAGRAPGALIEPYFGSHVRSCDVADGQMEELAQAIYAAAKASV